MFFFMLLVLFETVFQYVTQACLRFETPSDSASLVLGLQTCYNNLLAHRTGWDRSPDNDESVVQKIRREDWKTFQEANESSDR